MSTGACAETLHVELGEASVFGERSWQVLTVIFFAKLSLPTSIRTFFFFFLCTGRPGPACLPVPSRVYRALFLGF